MSSITVIRVRVTGGPDRLNSNLQIPHAAEKGPPFPVRDTQRNIGSSGLREKYEKPKLGEEFPYEDTKNK